MLKVLKRIKARIKDISNLLFEWYWETLKKDFLINKKRIKRKIELTFNKIKTIFTIFKIKIINIVFQEQGYFSIKIRNYLIIIVLIKESIKSIKYICFL